MTINRFEEKHTVTLTGAEFLALCGQVILALIRPNNKGPSANLAHYTITQLCNLIIDHIPPEIAAEWRRALEERSTR